MGLNLRQNKEIVIPKESGLHGAGVVAKISQVFTTLEGSGGLAVRDALSVPVSSSVVVSSLQGS